MNQTFINQQINEIFAGPMPTIQAFMLELESSDEHYVSLCRGRKSDFEGAEHFWLKARQRREWWDKWGDGEGFGGEYESYKHFAASVVKAAEPLTYISLSAQDFTNLSISFLVLNLYPNFWS